MSTIVSVFVFEIFLQYLWYSDSTSVSVAGFKRSKQMIQGPWAIACTLTIFRMMTETVKHALQ